MLSTARIFSRFPSRWASRTATPRANRAFTNTPPHARPTANHIANSDLLQRSPNRPLPTLASLSATRRWLLTFPIFLSILTASALGIFNYQKVNSPITTATLYALRTNREARDVLGDEVYFASKWAWIWGKINLVQGNVDVNFKVKGTKEEGVMRFVAKRLGGKGGRVSPSSHLGNPQCFPIFLVVE